MKVCLIAPTMVVPKGHEDRIRIHYPIGLVQIAAILEKNGIEVELIDALAEGWNNWVEKDGYVYVGISDESLLKRIKESSPEYVGVSSYFTPQRTNLIRTAKLLKKLNVTVIAGGLDPSIEYEHILKTKEIDYVVVGEADHSFLELIQCLDSKGDVDKIKGIAYKNKFTGKRDVTQNLNELPRPAYHLLKFDKYFQAGKAGYCSRGISVEKWMSIVTSRGCPYKCVFCSIHQINGRVWRGKSSEKVLDEIEYLYKTYKITYFFIEDDNLTANVSRAKEIFDGIVERGLDIQWETPNGIRADTITDELAKKMKLSGCKKLILGVENGDQKFLKEVVKKNLDLKKVIKATKYIYKHKIECAGFFIMGIPGETRKVMIKSILFAMRLARYGMVPGFGLAVPLPKTEMYEIADKKKYLVKSPLTPDDYLNNFSTPLIETEHFKPTDLMRWKKIATLLTTLTVFVFHPSAVIKTNTFQEIRKHPTQLFAKVRAVLRGSS